MSYTVTVKLFVITPAILLTLYSASSWSSEIQCDDEIYTVADLDECLIKNKRKPTRSYKEILEWKKKLSLSAPLEIEVQKIQKFVEEKCNGKETPQLFAEKLALEVEQVMKIGSLQIKNWKVPNFPPTGAWDYSMKKSAGCKTQDLIQRMQSDVKTLIPDLTNVYNLGLAIDTTESQGENLRILAANIDSIYSSIPANANIAFVVTAYGDEYRSGLKFEGSKSYVLPRVKSFILGQKIHGGGTPPEFVYGGSYLTSKNLERAHGLIFNWTNATADNTKAKTSTGSIEYTLKDLNGFAIKNVHMIRNVFLRCN